MLLTAKLLIVRGEADILTVMDATTDHSNLRHESG